MSQKQIVLASNNSGKLREFTALLAPKGVSAITQGSLGIPEAEEPFHTFVENALQKARHASQASGLPAMADDSGICVPALGGAPGVYSARFATEAGYPKSDEANNAYLLEKLSLKSDRRAYYYATIVLVKSFDDPCPLITQGIWWGEVLTHPRGDGGFGYDPLFFIPELGKSAAELSSEEKNRLSHRAKAVSALMSQWDEFWF